MKVWLRVLVGASLALGSATADAQATGSDVVALDNGGRLRGTVLEYEPGVRVVIEMADGTTRTIAGAEVASVVFADAAAVIAPPSPPAEPIAALPSQPSEPAVERWSTPREFNAPRSDWSNDSLALAHRAPQGDFHLGVQLEAGVLVLPLSEAVAGVAGVYGFLEIPIGRFATFRIGPSLSYAGGGELNSRTYDNFRGGLSRQFSLSRSLAVGGRFLLGADLGDGFFRAGIEGLSVPDVGAFEAAARVEFGYRFLPQRSLEVGVGVAAGVTHIRSVSIQQIDSVTYQSYGGGYTLLLPRVDLFLGWVFE